MTTRHILWASLGAAFLVRLLFVATFPLNDLGGDAGNYRAMLLKGHSSLVHAGGYPFVIGVPFRFGAAWMTPTQLSYALLVTQHAIDFSVLTLMAVLLSRLYGGIGAAVAVLIAGTSPEVLSATSATYPEWFQADLLVLALAAGYAAFITTGVRNKLLLYGAAASVFTLCTAVKFNGAIAGFFLPAALLSDSLPGKHKLIVAVACIGVMAGTLAPYLHFYQFRTTGTYALTYDTAWVLLTRVEAVTHNRLDPQNGLNTRRWLALSGLLPRSYDQAGPALFSHVDAVSADVRAPYTRYHYLLTARPDIVTRVLARTSLPDGFSVGLSVIPVAYYMGLAESDHLGVRVAAEAMMANPRLFAEAAGRDLARAVRQWPADAPFASIPVLGSFDATPATELTAGYVRLQQRRDSWNVPFSFSSPIVWWPGVRLFTMLQEHWLPPYWGSLALGLALIVAATRVVVLRRIDLSGGVTLLVAAIVVIFATASVAMLDFRWKEARVVAPLVALLGGAATSGIVSAISLAWTSGRRSSRSPEPVGSGNRA